VGQHIFQACINGALKGKTRLLVTHQIHLLPECDEIIILENGCIKACGSYEELTRSGIDITAFIPRAETVDGTSDDALIGVGGSFLGSTGPSTPIRIPSSRSHGESRSNSFNTFPATPATAASPPSFMRSISSQHSDDQDQVLERVNSIFSEHSEVAGLAIASVTESSGEGRTLTASSPPAVEKEPAPANQLMTIEEKGTGDVDMSVYWYYIQAGGKCTCAGVVVFLLLVQVFALGSNFYLTYWGDKSNDREDGDNPMSNKTNMQYMAVFAALSMGGVICLVIRGLFLAEAQMTASLQMHSRLIDSILGAPVGFFDVTPLGKYTKMAMIDNISNKQYVL
jgi:ATP-binding cassette, subfamily C (CFTR/MRP), member 2